MESATVAVEGEKPPAAEVGDKGLKKDSIGFLDGLAIGLDSTAPAYSLAAVIGSIVVAAGVQAPAVLLVSFIPMFFIAGSFYYMNKVDPDCGSSDANCAVAALVRRAKSQGAALVVTQRKGACWRASRRSPVSAAKALNRAGGATR